MNLKKTFIVNIHVFHFSIAVNFDPADTAKVQREMCTALKARREALEEILKKRTEELKLLCIKEGVCGSVFSYP